MKKISVFLLLFLCLCINQAFAGAGTLIVTYQTDKQGERLERIRFWVHGDHFKQWLYPKKNMFVEDQPNKTRRVVIENLPEGEYAIEFLIPNTDRYFADVPIRKVTITPGAVVKINQHISLREESPRTIPKPEIAPVANEQTDLKTGSLIISYSSLDTKISLDEIRFYLISGDGKNEINFQNDSIINAVDNQGRVAILTDIPIGNYKIVFFKEGQKASPLLSEDINVQEDTTISLHYSLLLEN